MVRTIAAWVLGIMNTIAWGSLSICGSVADRSGRWAHTCMVRWSRINLRLMGTTVEARGLEHVLRDSPQIFAVNHQSLVDILVLAATLPVPFRFVAKRELFELPFLGWHMRRAGFVPIDRGRPTQAARLLLVAADRIKAGVNAVVFPEGTRSPDGKLLPFRGGGFLLAIRSGVPVVPIALTGTRSIVRKGEWSIHPAKACLQVRPPVDVSSFADDREALAARVREEIEIGIAAMSDRVEPTPDPVVAPASP